jgi:GNAT superfamily N-acetyltransferase
MSTNMEQITIRRADAEDADFIAQVILLSGRAHVEKGIWEVILGGTEKENIEFLTQIVIADPPHLFHYSCFLIAEVEDVPVAGLGGYDPNVKGYDRLREAIENVRRKTGRASDPETAERARRVLSCLPQNIKGAWIIDSVATLPNYRRKGISEALLKEIVVIGKRNRFKKAQVCLYIGNMPAQKAYEKLGFSINEEKRDRAFMEAIGSPGMMSMATYL